jgi:predicted secreted hydrolase
MIDKEFEEISLPKDVGPHRNSNIEWWYNFSYLSGDKGGRYAVMVSFFQVGEPHFNKGHYVIYSLIDLNKKTQINYSLFDSKLKLNMLLIFLPFYLLLNPNDAGMKRLYKQLLIGQIPKPHKQIDKVKITKNPTVIQYGENAIKFSGDKEENIDLHLENTGFKLDLQFIPRKQASLIAGDGKPDDLYYLSYTNNEVKGQLQNKYGIENVYGNGWFDHQWGYDKGIAKGIGWNWFGIQLDDGRELLLNEKHDRYTKKKFGQMANIINQDGTLEFSKDVSFKEISYWTSIVTKAKYPVEWHIIIPEFSMELYIKPAFNKQEMPILGPLQAIWEGACQVEGFEIKSDGRKVPIYGKAFMELVGYAFRS